jgi:hypothetical protein
LPLELAPLPVELAPLLLVEVVPLLAEAAAYAAHAAPMSARASATVPSPLSLAVVVVVVLVEVVVVEPLDALAASSASPSPINPENGGGAPLAQCAQPCFLPCEAAVHSPCRFFGAGGSVVVVVVVVVVVPVEGAVVPPAGAVVVPGVDAVDDVVHLPPPLPLPLLPGHAGLPCAGEPPPALASAGIAAPPEKAKTPIRMRDRSRACMSSTSTTSSSAESSIDAIRHISRRSPDYVIWPLPVAMRQQPGCARRYTGTAEGLARPTSAALGALGPMEQLRCTSSWRLRRSRSRFRDDRIRSRRKRLRCGCSHRPRSRPRGTSSPDSAEDCRMETIAHPGSSGIDTAQL